MQIIPPPFDATSQPENKNKEILQVLDWILNNGHGGGNWRRIITLKMSEYED